MAVSSVVGYKPQLPFPIACISLGNRKRYMLYDIDLVSWLRREHHILGVLIGSLPQAPSQNVFLGMPLELMPEETQLLLEKKLAVIVDDRAWHLTAIQQGTSKAKVEDYQSELLQKGHFAAEVAKTVKEMKLEEVMKNLSLMDGIKQRQKQKITNANVGSSPEGKDLLFNREPVIDLQSENMPQISLDHYAVTPTGSGSLTSENSLLEIHKVDASSYELFKMLHNKGYFLSPGLRFGCQYMAYPGDPLRYHSHFLTVSSDWDKPIDLIDIIGSGRLATGVKKSFLLGGIAPSQSETDAPTARAFSIEWAGM